MFQNCSLLRPTPLISFYIEIVFAPPRRGINTLRFEKVNTPTRLSEAGGNFFAAQMNTDFCREGNKSERNLPGDNIVEG